MRLAILFDNFGPYHYARLNAANRHCETVGVQARAKSQLYAWTSEGVHASFPSITLSSDASGRLEWRKALRALDERLGPYEPDVVATPGWSSLAAMALLHWATRRGIPAILMSESNRGDFPSRPLVESTKRLLVSSFASALVGNELQKDYLVALGMERDRIFVGYDVVDNAYFNSRAKEVRDGKTTPAGLVGTAAARAFGRFFLCSARFVEKKNLARLIDAYAIYASSAPTLERWPLVIAGDGPLRPQLEHARAERGLTDWIAMPGFVQYGELPGYYGAAGAFILASMREQWGLVVNEAMASGLPALVSNRCGCSHALVQSGVNGCTFDPENTSELANLMAKVAASPERRAMGEASERIIADWGPERFGKGMLDAAQRARSVRQPAFRSARALLFAGVGMLQEYRSVAGYE